MTALNEDKVAEGLMWARKRRCLGPENPCPHHRVCRAWQWPRCQAGPCDEDGTPLLEITKAFFLGPEDGCPKGFWVGLQPVNIDPSQPSSEDWTRYAERFLERFEPIVKRLSKDDLQRALLEMVAVGFAPELALEIGRARGIDPNDELPEEQEPAGDKIGHRR